MIRFMLLLILVIKLFATPPVWYNQDPDNKAKYFRGVSTWYVTGDYRMQRRAQKDSLQSAYLNLAPYFGIRIDSTMLIKQNSNGVNANRQVERDISTKSNQLVFDVKPFRTYTEFNKDRKNFRIYTLLKLDPITEQRIKNQISQDKEELKQLEQKILTAINNKNLYQAQTLLSLAKGKMTAFMDDTLINLEKRIENLKNTMLFSTISVNKKRFLPDEDIKLNVSINHNGYLYVFYDTSDDVEMLFPNEYHTNPHLRANTTISFPNDDISLQAYEKSLNKKIRIFTISSKKFLNFLDYKTDTIDGVYIFNKNIEQNKIILECLKEGDCTKNEVTMVVSNTPSIKIDIVLNSNDLYLKRKFSKILSKFGIKSTKNSNVKIKFTITKNVKHSSILESNITTYKIKATLYKNNVQIKSISNEVDVSNLEEGVVNLYKTLIESL